MDWPTVFYLKRCRGEWTSEDNKHVRSSIIHPSKQLGSRYSDFNRCIYCNKFIGICPFGNVCKMCREKRGRKIDESVLTTNYSDTNAHVQLSDNRVVSYCNMCVRLENMVAPDNKISCGVCGQALHQIEWNKNLEMKFFLSGQPWGKSRTLSIYEISMGGAPMYNAVIHSNESSLDNGIYKYLQDFVELVVNILQKRGICYDVVGLISEFVGVNIIDTKYICSCGLLTN